MECHQLVDHGVEVLGKFLVGYPLDLPTHETCRSVAALVVLGVEAATVPGDVVDLERPFDRRVGSIWMDRGAVAQSQRVLTKKHDASVFERSEHAEFEP